ncbi:MAG: type II toxin-antitoxin system VapC family toxin [Dysgonamonadaceae bacterium]|jgi:predicted nucleic acid-binding protein|nr:type II toxin-antitoxin system VapC family toxin [Dysgonamonadaceae bacterium]
MNGIDFLADTNILLYVLEGYPVVSGIAQSSIAVSVISEIELLGKKGILQDEITAIRHLLDDCTIIPLTFEIKEITISLKQTYKLKIPDAVVAATAIHFGFPLITADADFLKISNLNLIRLNLS